MPPSLLLDCDPGHDDVMAILTAARYGALVGITTVAGNAALEYTTRNALVTCELAGLDLPVHAGAAGPLKGEQYFGTLVHGEDGLDGVEVGAPTTTAAGDDAPSFIVETARTTPDLWLVPVGPLTNIALALERDPGLARRVAGISIMGGGAIGNVTPTAEFNIFADPEAADRVFRSGARIRMCGLDVTHQVCATPEFIASLTALGTPIGEFTAALLTFYARRVAEVRGRELAAIHDACAVLAVTHPELFEFGRHSVNVELAGRLTRGMTVIDRRLPETGAVEVAWRVDAERALELIAQAVVSA